MTFPDCWNDAIWQKRRISADWVLPEVWVIRPITRDGHPLGIWRSAEKWNALILAHWIDTFLKRDEESLARALENC